LEPEATNDFLRERESVLVLFAKIHFIVLESRAKGDTMIEIENKSI